MLSKGSVRFFRWMPRWLRSRICSMAICSESVTLIGLCGDRVEYGY